MRSVIEEELVTGMTFHSAEFHEAEGEVPPDDAWQELLSAYLDGEVNDEERMRVEDRLKRDAGAREELQELRRLSSVLGSLPRHAPPPELASLSVPKVVQSVSAAIPMSGGSEAVAPGASHPSLRPARRFIRRREWLAGITALAMTVLLVVSLRVPGPFSDEKSVASNIQGEPLPMLATTSRFDTPLEMHEEEALGAAARPMTDGFHKHAKLLGDDALRHQLDSASSLVAAKEGSLAFDAPMMKGAPSPASAQDSEELLSQAMARDAKSNSAVKLGFNGAGENNEGASGTPGESLQQWQDVQPYLNLLAQNTGAVANVDLMVLDVHQAADQFQVLLLQNGVIVDSAPSPSPAPPTADLTIKENVGRAAPERASGQEQPKEARFGTHSQGGVSLTAVYVEAQEPAVTKALEEMVRQRRVLALRLQPPLQFDVNEPAGPPAKASETDGIAHRDVSRHLQEAYWSVQMANAGDVGAVSGPVSAQSQLGNQSLEGVAEKAPLLVQGNDGSEQFGPQRDRRNARSMAVGQPAESGSRQNNFSLTAQGLPGGAGESKTEDANFGQRVNLSTAPDDWYLQLQNSAKAQTLAEANDAAFQKTLDQQRGANGNSMRAMQRNFRRAAPSSVRVLFVLQPAPAGSAGTPAP